MARYSYETAHSPNRGKFGAETYFRSNADGRLFKLSHFAIYRTVYSNGGAIKRIKKGYNAIIMDIATGKTFNLPLAELETLDVTIIDDVPTINKLVRQIAMNSIKRNYVSVS